MKRAAGRAGRSVGRGVLSACLVGLALRLAFVAGLPTEPFSDFAAYFENAKQLARAGNMHGLPAMHPPGYPLVLVPFLAMTPSAAWLVVAKVVKCLLGAWTVFLGARLARRLWGGRVAILAAWFLALYPRLLVQPSLIASENLFTPLLFVFVALLADAFREENAVPRAAASGAAVGALALTRALTYYIPLVWVAASLAGGRKPRRVARDLLVLLVVQHAILLPWALRNREDLGRFTFLTTSSGMALFNGNNDNATGGWYPWMADLVRLRPEVAGQPATVVDEVARQEAIRWIRAHPRRAFGLYFRKLWMIVEQDALAPQWATAAPPGRADSGGSLLLRHRGVVVVAVRIAAAVFGVLGLVGGLLLLRGLTGSPAERAATIGFLGTMAFIPAVSAWIAVNGRYRWPVEDLLLILAAWTLASAVSTWTAGRTRAPVAVAGAEAQYSGRRDPGGD